MTQTESRRPCADASQCRGVYLESGRTGSAGVSVGTYGALWKKGKMRKNKLVIELSINLERRETRERADADCGFCYCERRRVWRASAFTLL